MKNFLVAKKLSILVAFIVATSFAYGAESRYGKFTLESGKGYVIRDSKKINLELKKDFEVLNNDLIRLTDNSAGKLFSNEKATIELGSNAVLKVKSWEESNTKGYLSLLYGKIKATIAGLSSSESFNVRTANSVIGVKGTEYTAGANEDGNSYAWTLERYVYLTDVARKNQMVVPTGYYAANFSDSGLQKMIYVGNKASIQEINSSAPGIKDKIASTDKFFLKRDDIGSLPVLNIAQAAVTANKAVEEQKELVKTNLITVNYGISITGP